MNVAATALPGVLIVEPRVFGDARGFFFESWNQQRYAAAGIGEAFVQDNVSRSARGVLRGLHLQQPGAQGKLVGVLEGEVFDVAVDVRRGSPHFGLAVAVRLSATDHRQLYVPAGFAHGFQVLSESALFAYKCTEYYRPEDEISILWNDPELAIDWPLADPVLSEKDRRGCLLRELAPDRQPEYR
jgi:dTDP-4-dehydrorhamnose 3,5-epimerase